MAEQESQTHYINTDMEIRSNTEPLHLKAVFHGHQFFDMTERILEDGSWIGCYETGEQYIEPDANIAGFLDVVEGLEGAALYEWQKCTLRVFDIGYRAGYEPFRFEQMLTVETLSRVVIAGAVIRFSVYAPDPEHAPIRLP